MNRLFHIVAVLLIVGAVWFLAIGRKGSDAHPPKTVVPDPAAARPPGDSPGSGEGAGGGALTPSADPSAPGVDIPKHLLDPRVLDPIPLALNFAGPAFERRDDGRIFKTDVVRRGKDLNQAGHEPEDDLQVLEAVIASYRTIFQQNPVAGENREVVEALLGRNAHRLVFLDPSHPAINAQGELTDRWGTPYRFHPLSGTHMEFSSAGADGQFGTKDDVELDERVVIGDRGPES